MKLAVLITVILGALVWLAVGGAKDNQAYFKTVGEVLDMGEKARDKRIRVGGDVVAGSIVRTGGEVKFDIVFDNKKLPVVYSGVSPLPDTFKDGAQALADGKLGSDGVFHATQIQAKCASKYEAKPPSAGKPGWERKPVT